MRLSEKDQQLVLDAIQELYACRDMSALPEQMMSLVKRLVPCDTVSYNEWNKGGYEYRALFLPRWPDIDPLLAVFNEHLMEHPGAPYFAQGWWSPLRNTDRIPLRQYQRTHIYNEFYRVVDVEYQLTTALETKDDLRVAFALNRDKSDFSERDIQVLSLFYPHLNQAYENARLMGHLQHEATLLHDVLQGSRQAVVVLDGEGRITWMNEQAKDWLETFFNRPFTEPNRLGPPLSTWLEQEEKKATDSSSLDARFEPLIAENAHDRLVIRLVETSPSRRVLLLQRQAQPDPAAFQKAFGLTSREAEVFRWLAQGKTNREIALLLGTQIRTIDKHVERLLAKIGVESRQAAIRTACEATCV